MNCGLYRYSPVSVPVVEDCEARAEGCLSSEDAEALARCLQHCSAESRAEARGAEQLAQDCESACALAPTTLPDLPEEDDAPDP